MDRKSLWENIIKRLAPSISRAHLLSFFKDAIISDLDNGHLTIALPTIYAFDFIRARHEAKILQAAKDICSEVREISFEIKGSLLDEHHPHKFDLQLLDILDPPKTVRKLPGKQEVLLEGKMRSKMFNS